MKQKYYLRGLGIGILITALVFIIAGPSELSEEEIIKRAEELGYTKVEEDVTPSIGIKELLETGTPTPTKAPETTKAPQETLFPQETLTPAPGPTEEVQPSGTPVPTETPTPVPTETPTPIPTPTAIPSPTNTPSPTPQPTSAPESTVVTAAITVERGDSARMVCEKIEAAGILTDGDELLQYFIRHDLADYINVGTYTLSSDMTLQEMAKLLTGR